MKNLKYFVSLVVVISAVVGCKHDPLSSSGAHSAGAPAEKNQPTTLDYGTKDGTLGGECRDDVFSDFLNWYGCSTDQECEADSKAFTAKYNVVSCLGNAGGLVMWAHTQGAPDPLAPKSTPKDANAPAKAAPPTCDERQKDLTDIQTFAQSELEGQTHGAFQGIPAAGSDALKKRVTDFDGKYGKLECSGQESLDDFDAEMKRYDDELDQLR